MTDRVEPATVNNFRAVADPGKSFSRPIRLNVNTPAITTSAMLIARTAGLSKILLLVREPFSRLGRDRNKTHQFRYGSIKVLLINKFIGAVFTRYRSAHGTVS